MKARERINLTTGWAEWDRGSFVRVGNRAIPKRIDVTFPSTADKWPALEMTIEVRNGVPGCTDLRLVAQRDGRDVRDVDLRGIRLREWVENITAEAAMEVFVADDGSELLRKTFSSGSRSTVVEQEFRDARSEIRHARSGARRTMTDDVLRQVAETYRANLSDRPVEAVRNAFGTSHRTAARYVQAARDRGFLPPTTQGKVSG